jgi:hypothetical protein
MRARLCGAWPFAFPRAFIPIVTSSASQAGAAAPGHSSTVERLLAARSGRYIDAVIGRQEASTGQQMDVDAGTVGVGGGANANARTGPSNGRSRFGRPNGCLARRWLNIESIAAFATGIRGPYPVRLQFSFHTRQVLDTWRAIVRQHQELPLALRQAYLTISFCRSTRTAGDAESGLCRPTRDTVRLVTLAVIITASKCNQLRAPSFARRGIRAARERLQIGDQVGDAVGRQVAYQSVRHHRLRQDHAGVDLGQL